MILLGLAFVVVVISLLFFLMALFRIAESKLSDGIKLGWIALILFMPILGSICALVVVKKEPLKMKIN